MKQFASYLCLALLWAAGGVSAHAQIGQNGGPIDITADESIVLTEERMVRWIGAVDARQGNARLLADEMIVYFAEEGDGEGLGDIVRIVAEGSVAYVTAEETARGDRGVYDFVKDEIEITGNVVLIRGPNTSTGARLIVEPSLGRARLVGEAIERGDRRRDRVRAVFFPEEDQTDTPQN